MKKIFTLLTSLILGISVFATDARPKSMLTIKSVDKGDIKVVIDGKRFEPGFSSVMITEVESGYHSIKVYRQVYSNFFTLFGKRYEIVYNNSLFVKPFTQVQITIDRLGQAFVDEQKIRGNDRDRDDDHDNGNHYGQDKKWGDDDRNTGWGTYNAYSNVMSNVEFNRVLDAIQKEWFESNKMKSAKQIISSNVFTSLQVKQLLQLFNFESNKLELAKLAYTKTIDKQNYQCVADVLFFSSSKDELARFIRDCR